MKQLSLFSILCFFLIGFAAASFFRRNMSQQWDGFHAQRHLRGYDANRRLILSYLPSNVTAQKGLFYNVSVSTQQKCDCKDQFQLNDLTVSEPPLMLCYKNVQTKQKRIHGQVIPRFAMFPTQTLLS
ncbi:unnamed protein product [Eruca vesicaria subsp. sativa]|uniref:Uncharacterized protein n=1 Tax=Eruca vesicaria subsp. sativa TaxID=29727 RepID=A0ABC8KD48_ERUVS|nr:unnamed protein product [Eruca vesicaria subsp. sativa]